MHLHLQQEVVVVIIIITLIIITLIIIIIVQLTFDFLGLKRKSERKVKTRSIVIINFHSFTTLYPDCNNDNNDNNKK